ncbi:MAG: ATP-binding protein [Deltaproteobacteria bacterium]|nr:ATP-binding protein [Deltaproteobacteria bacterium]
MFIGRQKELSVLENAYKGKQSALIPIYGRRRVGKSELILKFMGHKAGIYYLGKVAPAALQIREFLQVAARALDEPLLSSQTANSWSEVFAAVANKCKSRMKFVIVLDEFQWMAGASPELPSVIQEYWDRSWKDSGNMVFILCGSYIGFMEREVLGRKSPLFGRRTAQILLRPFSYLEAAEFHPRWSLLNRALVYFICGGIPLYLRFFNQAHSIERNIEEKLLDEFGPLFREPDFLLREELRDVENYYAVLTAVAAGYANNQAIASQTGIPERSLHYYLQQLNSIGYIGRRRPLTGKKPNPRQVRYVLQDPLLRFWFRFVFPNLSFIQQMGPRRAYHERIRPELDTYFGLCFERFCRQALPVIYEREGVGAAFEVGEYWDKEVQIDVVGLRDDHWTDLGECKWGAVKSYKRLLEDMERKIRAYPNTRGATICKRVFLRKKPGVKVQGSSDVLWYGLEDLYRRHGTG